MPLMEAESRPITSYTRRHPRHIPAGVQTQFPANQNRTQGNAYSNRPDHEKQKSLEITINFCIFTVQLLCFTLSHDRWFTFPFLRFHNTSAVFVKHSKLLQYPENTPSHSRRRVTNKSAGRVSIMWFDSHA